MTPMRPGYRITNAKIKLVAAPAAANMTTAAPSPTPRGREHPQLPDLVAVHLQECLNGHEVMQYRVACRLFRDHAQKCANVMSTSSAAVVHAAIAKNTVFFHVHAQGFSSREDVVNGRVVCRSFLDHLRKCATSNPKTSAAVIRALLARKKYEISGCLKAGRDVK